MDGIEPSPYHCTPYVEDADFDNCTPCKCPVCGGFLTWDKTGEIPICNNCGAELAKVPKQKPKEGEEESEEDDEVYGDGKICVLSPPKYSKEERREKRRQRREEKNRAKKERLERSRERAQKAIDALNKRLEALS